MQLSKIALAAALTAAASAAVAAPNASQIVRSSGASAVFGNYRAALISLCGDANGVATLFTSGSNIATIVCADTSVTSGAAGTYVSKAAANFRNFAGTSVAEVRINVAGGSYTSVQAISTGFAGDSYFNPATAALVTETGSIGGFSDVDLTGYTPEVLGSAGALPASLVLNQPAGVAQVFGVAASNLLYTAMFNKQKADGLIPATCAVGDTGTPACVPSISKGDMVAIMDSNEFDAFSLFGAEQLGAAAGTELRYARRVDTSGSQASAQTYFLQLPCAGANARQVIFDPADTIGTIGASFDDEPGGLKDYLTGGGLLRVSGSPGTGDVRSELNSATNYVIGVISGENNQTGQSWKWLRVAEVPMAEDATPGLTVGGVAKNSNRATVLSGRYDFYEELIYSHVGTPLSTAFFSAVAGKLQTLTPPVGLITLDGVTMTYSKNGRACTPSAKL